MFTNENSKKKLSRIVAPAIALSILVGASPSFAYTVKSGDTLSEIASEHNMKLNDVVALNPQIRNINMIYVGDEINTDKKQATNVVNAVNVNVDSNVTQAEKTLLAKLVEAEAKGEHFAGKVAVASVVLNRVDSLQFPDTISGVIYQSGQFSPVSNGSIHNTPSNESVQAVEQAIVSGDTSNGALFFYNAGIVGSSWLDTKQTTAVIGNHTFKR